MTSPSFRRQIIAFALLSLIFGQSVSTARAAELFGPGNGDVTANVGVVSQYIFRGLSQSDEGPALQAGAEYAHPSGLYAGVWGSNVDCNDGNEANVEIDWTAGWRTSHDKLTLDMGAIYYWYPGADGDLDYDYIEAKLAAGYDFEVFNLLGAVFYSPDFFAGSGNSLYASLDGGVPLPYDLTLKGHYGYQWIDDEGDFGSPDYADWMAGLSYNFKGVDLTLSYVDTDLDDGVECVKGWCDERILFSASYAFK